LNFGAGVLARAGEKSPDLVIIDEVGHLERFGGGWAREMDELVQRGQVMIWSVRPSLLDEIAAIWPIQYELMAAETLDKEAFSKKVDEFLASR
jgi:nucleoside-triphosphatase THEP1